TLMSLTFRIFLNIITDITIFGHSSAILLCKNHSKLVDFMKCNLYFNYIAMHLAKVFHIVSSFNLALCQIRVCCRVQMTNKHFLLSTLTLP
ncbi:hypothetical protein L9F63_024615, partial [Diploptera punctata]